MPPAPPRPFELQGHRGARGLRPENTLPSFETAFDLGVTSVETDVHLTRDGVPILFHDPQISERVCQRIDGGAVPPPEDRPAIHMLRLDEIRCYRADRNPDPRRFPDQQAADAVVARLYGAKNGFDPYTPPTLADLFSFTAAYAGDLGTAAGKSDAQRSAARRVRFDIELKRVPFRPEAISDSFNGREPGLLEERVVASMRQAGVVGRSAVRSFDHRSIRAIRRLEPQLATGVLITDTAPVSPARLVHEAEAQTYCPSFEFLDEAIIRQVQAEGIRVLPWTVNAIEDWQRLLDWGVDGITTDFPNQLAGLLAARGMPF